MKSLSLSALAVLLAGLSACMAAQAQSNPKSLVIAIDGARADAIELANMPNLDRLIAGTWQPGYRGAYAHQAQTIKDADTNSGPNHVSIFTSVTAAKHGVTGNNNAQMSAVDELDDLSILEMTNSALDTVKLVTWSPDALVPTAADYLKASSDANSASQGARMLSGTYSDADWAAGRDVDAMFVFFDEADHAGHGSGWLSATYLSTLATIDTQIGQLLAAVAARPGFANEDWQIVVTSDHGGYGTGHGTRAAQYFTIPFLVASKTAAQGVLAGRPRNADAAATVLRHFGVDPAQEFPLLGGGGYRLDGTARGGSVRPADPALGTGLVAGLRFENTYADSTGRGNAARVGAGTPAFIAGKFGRGVRIAKGSSQASEYLTLGNRPDLDFASSGFTFTVWYRAGSQSTDSAILGNKDWDSGGNPGVLLTAAVAGTGNELGLNLADTARRRADTYRIDTRESTSGWWFIAITVDRANGLSTLYAGSPGGKLYAIANEIDALQDLRGSLPFNIGQDGTGTSRYQLTADLDDLGIWRRALSKADIARLYNGGTGRDLCSATGAC